MSDTLTDPLPPLKPAEKYARIETDTFCLECGYNLHSQAVVRDERLGIFVCRCPECGRYHPAGLGMTATRTWLNRFATLLLFFWILIILFALFWIVMGFGAIQVAFVEDCSYRKNIAPDGREVIYAGTGSGGWVYKGTTQPVTTGWNSVYAQEPPADQRDRRPWLKWEVTFFAIGAAALGFVTGVLLVVFFWHWKRRRYVWPMLLPLAIAAVVSSVFSVNDEYKLILSWAVRMSIGWAMWELAWMGVGIVLGRKLARVMLRMFIPPKPRQHFAFLWAADGKVMPPGAVASADHRVIAVIDPTFVLSNRVEAGLWTAIGIGMAIGAFAQRGVVRRDCILGAITFALFGGSDLVEATTGAWWRPWWLFVWKAACVLALLVLLVRYVRRRQRANRE